MDDESNKDMEEDIPRKHICEVFNAWNVLQSIWVRCNTILSFYSNKQYILRQFNLVLYLGSMFWLILLLSKTF